MSVKGRVLVGIPIFKGHEKWVDEICNHYHSCDIMIIDNTVNDDSLYQTLQKLKKKKTNSIVEVQKHDWIPEEQWVFYMLGDCWNKCIDYAIKEGYDYLLWTSSDIFYETGCGDDGVELLQSHDKDYVGFPVNMYGDDGPPSVYKDTGMVWNYEKKKFIPNHYSWDELEMMPTRLLNCNGCIGFSLIKVDVIKKCRFKFPDYKGWVWGEDLFYLQEIKKEGFELFCDLDHRAINHTEPSDYVKDIINQYYRRWIPDAKRGEEKGKDAT